MGRGTGGHRNAGRNSNSRIERDYWKGDRFSSLSSRGFNCHIYLLKDTLNIGIYKIGISNDPHRRVEEINHRVRLNSFKHHFIIKSSVFIGEEKEAIIIEQALLSYFTDKIYSARIGFEGMTEVRNLTESDVTKVLSIFERLRNERKILVANESSLEVYTPPIEPLEILADSKEISRKRNVVNPLHETFEKDVLKPCLQGLDVKYTNNQFLYGATKGIHVPFYIESLRLAITLLSVKQGIKTAIIEGDVSRKLNCTFVKFRLGESNEVKRERLSLWIERKRVC